MIAVIDYGMGNLRSVEKALATVGLDARVTRAARDLDDARGVVLPGVGAFRDCMSNLDRLGLIAPIRRALDSGKPFLGICLGLQVLFSESEEFGRCPGLGFFAGRVVRFPDNLPDPDGGPDAPPLKVPHMGWNQVTPQKPVPVLRDIPADAYFYFVHSYYVAPEDPSIVATTTGYGIEFVSSIARDNVFASQFHPEKSQRHGLKLLRNFGETIHAD
jgi:glutamine amidotransferase